MRVVQVSRFGDPEVLVPVEAMDPVADPGQVVIEVAAVDVLFLDTMIRSGRATEFFPQRPPYVPGNGVAGTVISVGDDADPGWTGQRVVAHTGEGGGSGGYAEQVVAPAPGLVAVPAGVGLPDAAALLHDGATALGLLDGCPIRPGQSVLIVGASGGLGVLLVQIARAAGARVLAAARGERKLEAARQAGADVLVDDSRPEWPRQIREVTDGRGADLVFDNVGGTIGRAAFDVTADGGWFSAHGAPAGEFAIIDPRAAEARNVTLRGIERAQFTPSERVRWTRQALSEAAAGRLRPLIGQTFPLDQAADAHAAIEDRRVIGKTLLLI